jgi:hypothetical protein
MSIKQPFMKRPYFLLFIATLALFITCKKENQYSESTSKPESSKTSHKASNANAITSEGNDGMMEFAESTPNPYTLENMQQALDQLTAEAEAGEISFDPNMFNIRVTHKYIVFKPANNEEYETLIDDTTLILFDYPLHRKIIRGGTYYRDPQVQEGQPSYQWTCVPIEKQIDIGVHYEVLAELYLPEEDPNLVEYYDGPGDDYITMLIDQAMQLTGNYDTAYNYDAMTNDGTMGKWKLPSKWTPKGRITQYDDALNDIVNMRGVKVRAQRWFELRECLTDWNSSFNVLHQFRYPVNYSIKWERNDFEIRHKRIAQAYYNGPHHRGDWNLNISSGYSRIYAIIHRAAHRYYYEGPTERVNLRRPPLNNTMVGRISIGAFDWDAEGDNGDCSMIKRWTVFPEIRIFERARPCNEIYTTVCHELGHASHWDMGKNDFTFCDIKVAESWAVGVGNALFRLEYPKLVGRAKKMPNYTLVVIDMVDKPGEESLNNGFTNAQGDLVSGYTYREIENSLNEQRTWNDWKNKIKNDHNNATEDNLDALFELWD